MKMKKKIKIFMGSLAVFLVCCLFFGGIGYFYIDSKIADVKNDTPSVPYYSEVPENAGVLFEIGQEQTFFFLDFYYKRLNIIFNAEESVEDGNILGYPIDHYIKADYSLLAEIIDIVGGIELDTEEASLRYTGVQITDLLTTSTDYDKIERKIILKTIKKISENGFQKEDFLYIIENSETTLTVPVCYYWADYIKEICGFVNEVN